MFIGVFFSSYSAVREMVAHSGCFFAVEPVIRPATELAAGVALSFSCGGIVLPGILNISENSGNFMHRTAHLFDPTYALYGGKFLVKFSQILREFLFVEGNPYLSPSHAGACRRVVCRPSILRDKDQSKIQQIFAVACRARGLAAHGASSASARLKLN